MNSTDTTGIQGKDKKREYKFYYNRGYDGKYLFKVGECASAIEWCIAKNVSVDFIALGADSMRYRVVLARA